MLKNKVKKLVGTATLCLTVCSQVIFPQTAFAATKEAVEKAGEAFVAEMEENGAEAVGETEETVGTESAEANVTESTEIVSENGAEDTETEIADETSTGDDQAAEAEEVLSEEELRQQIVDFAVQFEGNPYVYGGTSLTNGADCSGFVMSVFAQFGYSLPRVAADQYYQSVKKDAADLEPGDLVFYGGGISHVALYIGNGQIIHASTSASGIKISNYDYEAPVGYGTYIEADGFYSE